MSESKLEQDYTPPSDSFSEISRNELSIASGLRPFLCAIVSGCLLCTSVRLLDVAVPAPQQHLLASLRSKSGGVALVTLLAYVRRRRDKANSEDDAENIIINF
ncbi:hypothetical protein TNCV_1494851 [Trichonephila clavipes]|nr:hypothetical protein TNCV_1494851 [Trichonephila clavipes]